MTCRKAATRCVIFALGAVALVAQQAPPSNPGSGAAPTNPPYTPPSHSERFQIYIWHTYGPDRIFEAAVWAGINQADHAPSEWPEGAKGYGERFGSVMGLYAVRGTAEYTLGEAFREDLRYVYCAGCSASGKLKAAVMNTFAARKGMDGHEDFSMARLLAPIAGGIVSSSWLPGKYDARMLGSEIGFTYTFDLARNLLIALIHH